MEECATNAHKCTQSQNCINSIGTYECNCRTGYDFNGLGDCIDIDECFTGIHQVIFNGHFRKISFEEFFKHLCFQCGDSACENGDGDYFCRCDQEKGKSGDAHSPENVYNCDDINECEADPNPCPQNSLCRDKQGGYECECSDGFKGDSCIDIDECRDECFESSQRLGSTD